jgi:hypothetical protein
MQSWKIKNGAVLLDTFDTAKKPIPINRHRIPNLGAEKVLKVSSGAPGNRGKESQSPDGPFMWDMDGRKHKKPKKKPQRVITSNASLHKVALPPVIK